MREVAGAILVLAGSVLIAAGIVADALVRDHAGRGNTGYVLGTVVGIVGLVLLFASAVRRVWNAIPVDDLGTNSPKSDGQSGERDVGADPRLEIR